MGQRRFGLFPRVDVAFSGNGLVGAARGRAIGPDGDSDAHDFPPWLPYERQQAPRRGKQHKVAVDNFTDARFEKFPASVIASMKRLSGVGGKTLRENPSGAPQLPEWDALGES
jgi:hypothetical protein